MAGQGGYRCCHTLLHDAVGPRDGTWPGIAILARNLEYPDVGDEGNSSGGSVESEILGGKQ